MELLYMDRELLINLCKQKLLISRLRKNYNLSSDIPALINNGSIDFESIDNTAIELLITLAEKYQCIIHKCSIDMSAFCTGEDGITLEPIGEPYLCYSSEITEFNDINAIHLTFMENNPDLNSRESANLLYLIQSMMILNGGLFNETHEAVIIRKKFNTVQINDMSETIHMLGYFFQNTCSKNEYVLQSGYDIEENGNEAIASIYLLRNIFYQPNSTEFVNSYTCGFDWDNFKFYMDFLAFNDNTCI